MYFLWTKKKKAWFISSGTVNSFKPFANIQHWLIQHQIKPQNFSLTLPICLGLVDNTEDILLHHALLIGRYHIYSSQIKNNLPNLQVFSQTFLKRQEIEKGYAYKKNTVKKYNSKWYLFKWTVTLIHFFLLAAPLLPFNSLSNFTLYFSKTLHLDWRPP